MRQVKHLIFWTLLIAAVVGVCVLQRSNVNERFATTPEHQDAFLPAADLDFPLDPDLFGSHFPQDRPDYYDLLPLMEARKHGPQAYDKAKRKLINKFKQMSEERSFTEKLDPIHKATPDG